MTAFGCCFCDGRIEDDDLYVEVRFKWNDSFDSETKYAHDGCLRDALQKAWHPDYRNLEIRGPTGASSVATCLQEGPGEEWREIALKAGFEQPDDEYPVEGTPDDLLDLEEVMRLAGSPQLHQLHHLLEDARSWGPGALAALVEEAHRRDAVTVAIIPDIIAIIVLLARPIEASEMKEKTMFTDALVEAIAAVAEDRKTDN
jgi:hypothetical protein